MNKLQVKAKQQNRRILKLEILKKYQVNQQTTNYLTKPSSSHEVAIYVWSGEDILENIVFNLYQKIQDEKDHSEWGGYWQKIQVCILHY